MAMYATTTAPTKTMISSSYWANTPTTPRKLNYLMSNTYEAILLVSEHIAATSDQHSVVTKLQSYKVTGGGR